jgi:hypothetical protein
LAVEELMRFYHVTTADAARSILAEGFRDGEGVYLADEREVWLTDDPFSVQISGAVSGDGGKCETIIEVRLDVADDAALAEFELINLGVDAGPAIVGVNYRQWLVPADWIKAHASAIAIVEGDDALIELIETLARERKPVPPLT